MYLCDVTFMTFFQTDFKRKQRRDSRDIAFCIGTGSSVFAVKYQYLTEKRKMAAQVLWRLMLQG